MLEQVVLDQKAGKREYDEKVEAFERKLGELQRELRELAVPVVIVFEGWDAAGKGTMINRLMQALDPRGFSVYPISAPTVEEARRPFLWRFWTRTPERGRIAIFDRSWYGRVLTERIDKLVDKKTWQASYEKIRSFERQLADDGAVVLKFFLHISKKEQKKRFLELEANPVMSWKVTNYDWKHHRQYEKYTQAIEDMLAQTDTAFAPWTIVESHDRRFATLKVFSTAIRAFTERIQPRREANGSTGASAAVKESAPQAPAEAGLNGTSLLDSVNLSRTLTRRAYERKLDEYQERVRELEHQIYLRRVPVVILYEGWDAAGKGGNIKRVTKLMDPRGYEVIPVGAPNDVEKSHHYLWRFWARLPKAGHITVFDRSWYGRVLVERVEGFCSPEEWKRAYREINEMEEQLVSFGAVLVKFWLQIDEQEQLKRFTERQEMDWKQWKITPEDWRNREKWSVYKTAVEEMLARTSTSYAPWTIVESNCKLYARIKTLQTVIKSIEGKLG
ncbi:MAG: phosphate--AMP phosphotransferase [Acidobacteria bacterium]|nr:MAG: phosphate--AMP phosphotransferase [Acidobacteriota bacterium]